MKPKDDNVNLTGMVMFEVKKKLNSFQGAQSIGARATGNILTEYTTNHTGIVFHDGNTRVRIEIICHKKGQNPTQTLHLHVVSSSHPQSDCILPIPLPAPKRLFLTSARNGVQLDILVICIHLSVWWFLPYVPEEVQHSTCRCPNDTKDDGEDHFPVDIRALDTEGHQGDRKAEHRPE